MTEPNVDLGVQGDLTPEPDEPELASKGEEDDEEREEREPTEEAADGLPTDTGRLHE